MCAPAPGVDFGRGNRAPRGGGTPGALRLLVGHRAMRGETPSRPPSGVGVGPRGTVPQHGDAEHPGKAVGLGSREAGRDHPPVQAKPKRRADRHDFDFDQKKPATVAGRETHKCGPCREVTRAVRTPARIVGGYGEK